MRLVEISPSGIRTLFEREQPDPKAISQPGMVAAAAAPEQEHPFLALSEPIALADLKPGSSYLLRDVYGRLLSVHSDITGAWQYAALSPFTDTTNTVYPVMLSPPSSGGQYTLSVRKPNVTWLLHSDSMGTSSNWAFWASADYSRTQPVMAMDITLAQTSPKGPNRYRIGWTNQGVKMELAADNGASVYLKVIAETGNPLLFSFHEVFLRASTIPDLLKKEWPNAKFVYQAYYPGDDFYLGLADQDAVTIFSDSGLARYKWIPEVFDCDDFSYVFKAQASKAGYAMGLEYGFALGVVFGTSAAGGHAVNLFLDVMGNVRVIEPQNGQIQRGRDWAYSPYFLVM